MRLLIIGSLHGQLGTATKIAMARGAKVSQADSIDAALESIRAGLGCDLVMVDVAHDIKAFIDSLKSEHIHAQVVACGVEADAKTAASAIRAGAKEYIPLPPDPDMIAAVFEAATEETHALIYRDPAMKELTEYADRVAPSEASILITGESGTGKEILSRYIHRKSKRNTKRFVCINCAAIPENLLESELFGHEKGAFTGAVARRIGKFEEANGGTLLLDEISEMDMRLQAKLLRAVQEREIDRVGGTKPVSIDIRLIATSNRDLPKLVAEGGFREDLYYRLNVVNLVIPPLRERKEDVILLAEHFVTKYSAANGVAERALSNGASKQLLANPWRGNVRELENTIHRAVLLSRDDEIGIDAIIMPDGSTPASSAAPEKQIAETAASLAARAPRNFVGRTVADVERELIIDTLDSCLGNRTHAANILGISIRTLRNKLKQYGDDGSSIPSPGEGREAAASRPAG